MTVYIKRMAGSFYLDDGRIDAVSDNVGFSADVPVGAGFETRSFLPAPYASIGNFQSGIGARGDKLTITLDGGHIISGPNGVGDANSVLQTLFDEKLRFRRVDVYRFTLNPDTMAVASVKHKFAGRIDDSSLDRENPVKPKFNIIMASYRVHAANPESAIMSDVDQRYMYPSDGGFKHLEDVVFNNGEFDWNKDPSGSGATGSANNYFSNTSTTARNSYRVNTPASYR